ncbi:MAG: hypothetical protein ACXWBN_06900 [Acidimicrobiales bacterium]
MVPLIVLIVVLAVGGGVAFLVKSRNAAAAASDEAGIGPNEFLQSPPTSFPSSPASSRSLEASAAEPEPAPAAPVAEPPVEAEIDEPAADDDDDEVVVARFKAPGERSLGSAGPSRSVATPPVYHLEAEPEPEPEATHEPEPTNEPAPEPVAEAPVLALVPDGDDRDGGDRDSDDVRDDEAAGSADGPVIDLLGEQAVVTPAEAVVIRPVAVEVAPVDGADDEAWQDVVLQPEPDAVDHVLQALINRARFKQVEVEAVATELVERADLQGQEVSEVLAELVGRADDSTLDQARTSELTLFNDEVPSRPGQLTDFARLAPAEKKRIIVRVLCLLVARSEDQQLPPRAEGETAEPRSWPLARAVWPLAATEDDGEPQLPSRRLAKSG